MKMSANGLALVKAFEGCHRAVPGQPGHFRAYRDPVGVLTIGYGHTRHHPPAFGETTVWTQAQCDAALASDLERFERHVEKMAKVPLAQHEFDALVSWAFNTGGADTATLWKQLNAGDKAAVPAELRRWTKAGGKTLAGLVRRREAEALLFQGRVAEALVLAAGKKVAPTKTVAATVGAGAAAGAAAAASGTSSANVIAIVCAVLVVGAVIALIIRNMGDRS